MCEGVTAGKDKIYLGGINKVYIYTRDDRKLQSSNFLSEVTAMSDKMYSAPLFNLNSFSLMNSVSVCLLSSFTC
jgi:hypothetical protein